MTSIKYPSATFPALPAICFEAGDGWRAFQPPGALLGLALETGEPAFVPNIIVNLTRFGPQYDFGVAIDSLAADLESLDESQITAREQGEVSGWPALVVEAVFKHAEAGTLIQVNYLILVGTGSARDLVHVAGTMGGDAVGSEYAQLREVMQSVAVVTSPQDS